MGTIVQTGSGQYVASGVVNSISSRFVTNMAPYYAGIELNYIDITQNMHCTRDYRPGTFRSESGYFSPFVGFNYRNKSHLLFICNLHIHGRNTIRSNMLSFGYIREF